MGFFDFFGDIFSNIGDFFGDIFGGDFFKDWGPMLLSLGGAAIGSMFGPWGAVIGYTLGSALGSALWPPSAEDPQKVRPEPQRMQIQTSMYGLPVASLYGTRRVAGNLLWTGNFRFDGTNYYQSFAWGLGFIYNPNYELKLMRAWANDEELDIEEFCTFYDGTQTVPDTTFQSLLQLEGKTRIPVFKNLGWVFMYDFPLGSSSNIPNFTFEIGIYYSEIADLGAGNVSWNITYGYTPYAYRQSCIYSTQNSRLYVSIGGGAAGDTCLAMVNYTGDNPYIEISTNLDSPGRTGGTVQKLDTCTTEGGQIIALERQTYGTCYLHFFNNNLGDHSAVNITASGYVNANVTMAVQASQNYVNVINICSWWPRPGGGYGGVAITHCQTDTLNAFTSAMIQDPDDTYPSTIGDSQMVSGYNYPTSVPDCEPGFWSYVSSVYGTNTIDVRQIQNYDFMMGYEGTLMGHVWRKDQISSSAPYEHNIGYCQTTGRVYLVYLDSNGDKRIRWYRDMPDMPYEADYEWTAAVGTGTPANVHIATASRRILIATTDNPLARILSHRGVEHTSYETARNITSAAFDNTNEVIYGCYMQQSGSTSIQYTIYKIDARANEEQTATDVTPPSISQDVLTSQLTGIGLSTTYLNLDDFNASKSWCVDNDIAVSMTFNTCMSILDWLSYIIAHHDGYIVYYDGEISHKQLRRETSNMLLTSEYFVKEESEPPVKINYPGDRDKFNRAQIEFTDRNDAYSAKATHVEDIADIDSFGLKPYNERLDGLMTEDRAKKMATARLLKSMMAYESYQVKLGPKSFALKPGEVITLTDTNTDLSNQKARIMSIRPAADYIIECDIVKEIDFYYNWHADAGDEFWRESE